MEQQFVTVLFLVLPFKNLKISVSIADTFIKLVCNENT
jgi:hypothetical protein